MSDREESVMTDAAVVAADTSNDKAEGSTSNGKKAGAKGSKKAKENGASASSSSGPIFPLTRVSRIIKADTDVETTSKDAVWTIAMATELFIKHITDSALANARLDKKRTLTYKELANAVESHPEFFFLTEVIPQPIALEEALRQRKELDAHIRARQVGLVEDDIEDSEEEQVDDAAEENEVSAAVDGEAGKAAAAAKQPKAPKKKKAVAAEGVESSDPAAATGEGSPTQAKAPRKPKVPGTTKSGAPQDPIAWTESRPLKANGQPRLKPGPKPKNRGLGGEEGTATPELGEGEASRAKAPARSPRKSIGQPITPQDEEMLLEAGHAASSSQYNDADMQDADELAV